MFIDDIHFCVDFEAILILNFYKLNN